MAPEGPSCPSLAPQCLVQCLAQSWFPVHDSRRGSGIDADQGRGDEGLGDWLGVKEGGTFLPVEGMVTASGGTTPESLSVRMGRLVCTGWLKA